MRVTKLEVSGWRNIDSVSLEIPPEAKLVCIVGENGTGKSNLLELVSAAATKFGLAHGVEMSRGNPLDAAQSFSIETVLGEDPADFFGLAEHDESPLRAWGGGLRFARDAGQDSLQALDLPDGVPDAGVFQQVANIYQTREEVAHLYLDSDRSYPSNAVHVNEFAQAFDQPFGDPRWQRQWTYRPSKTLYTEWLKFMLMTEQKAASKYAQAARHAAGGEVDQAPFEDPFESYALAISVVLPHLRFQGVDPASRTVVFDVEGTTLKFDDLSGGEREICFILGQIERFRLRRGLLLVDEPELHLNPDLLRRWLSYLRGSVETGQVWVATHSLEAAEVAGAEATFVLHRSQETRRTVAAEPVVKSPALALLSASVGSPAFSLHGTSFVLIEGDRQNRERARFHEICGNNERFRFLESGGCDEVRRRLQVLRELSEDIDYPLTLGAVLDRDFRSDDECEQLATDGVHTLGVHEIENLFLEPTVLESIARRHGIELDPLDLIREAADGHAGTWCLQFAIAKLNFRESTRMMRVAAGATSWAMLESGTADISAISGGRSDLDEVLGEAVTEYGQIRTSDDVWKHCCGKECLRTIPSRLGLTGPTFVEQAAVHCWTVEGIAMPAAAIELREFVGGLLETS